MTHSEGLAIGERARKCAGRVLVAYLRAPEHPFKLRIWNWLRAMSGERLVIPYGRCSWLSVLESDVLQRELLFHGVFESEVWAVIDAVAEREEVLWDVGANIGAVTLLAAEDSRFRRVVAFEPNPPLADLLSWHLKLSGTDAEVIRFGLAADDREVQLFLGPKGNLGQASIIHQRTSKSIPIQTTRADRIAEEYPCPTILKLDIEGAESAFFEGASGLVRNNTLRAMVVEAPVSAFDRNSIAPFIGQLVASGWSFHRFSKDEYRRGEFENFLALRANDPTTLARLAREGRETTDCSFGV